MVQKFNDAETVLTADGVLGKKRSDKYDCEIVQISIEGNKIIPAHVMDMPATFLITKGKGIAKIDENTFNIEKGDLIELDAGINREWRNVLDSVLEITVVKYMKQ